MDQNRPRNIAQQRWSMLRSALMKKRAPKTPPPCSLRVHNSLNLFQVQELSGFDGTWQVYTHKGGSSGKISVLVKSPSPSVLTEDLQVTDNTGNICIWASEQVMAHYCISVMEKFTGKSVLEIGGGYSCLAGLFVAKYGKVKRIVLSDGNEKALVNVEEIAQRNSLENCETECIRWDEETTYDDFAGKFDVVLCADCLFCDGQREKLAFAIFKLLKSGGEAIIFAPERGKTFSNFLHHAKHFFGKSSAEVVCEYDETMWELHQARLHCPSYNKDIHYPLLLKLKKCEKGERIFTAAHYA